MGSSRIAGQIEAVVLPDEPDRCDVGVAVPIGRSEARDEIALQQSLDLRLSELARHRAILVEVLPPVPVGDPQTGRLPLGKPPLLWMSWPLIQ